MGEPKTYTMTVLWSPEDAERLHACKNRYGFYLTLGEIKFREQTERAGFGHLLLPPIHNP